MPIVSLMAPMLFLGQDNQIYMQHDLFVYVMPLVLATHDNNGTVSGTWYWCQHWYSPQAPKAITPLNNHLNIANPMMWLMAPPTNQVIAMYMTKTNMPLNATHHICKLVYVHIWHFYVSIYNCYEPTAINNVNRNSGTHIFYIMHATVYMYSIALLL